MLFFVTIVVYVAVLLGVGVWKSRTTKTQDDFMVAGRTVSTWYLVGTLVCTWIGSGSLFGGAGLAFREGIGDLWMSAGAWVGHRDRLLPRPPRAAHRRSTRWPTSWRSATRRSRACWAR